MDYMLNSKMYLEKVDLALNIFFSVTSITRNRKLQGKPTYTAFLDAEKTFDRVDRDLYYTNYSILVLKAIYMNTLSLFIKKQLVLLV